jgi:hypothetical protein
LTVHPLAKEKKVSLNFHVVSGAKDLAAAAAALSLCMFMYARTDSFLCKSRIVERNDDVIVTHKNLLLFAAKTTGAKTFVRRWR